MKLFKFDEREKQEELVATAIYGMGFMITSFINAIIKSFISYEISALREFMTIIGVSIVFLAIYYASKTTLDWKKIKNVSVLFFVITGIETFTLIGNLIFEQFDLTMLILSLLSILPCLATAIVILYKNKKYKDE